MFLLGLAAGPEDASAATVLCRNSKGTKVTWRPNVCKTGETQLDPATEIGVGPAVYRFSGIAQNLPILSLTGWRQCYTDLYNNTKPLADVLAACPGPSLLLACRATGSGTPTLAASAASADVLFDTGFSNVLHEANGVGWYFSDAYSWGFAPSGAVVDRDECDVVTATDPDLRLCWHTFAQQLTAGYRCGDNDLNGSTAFERVIFEAPAE